MWCVSTGRRCRLFHDGLAASRYFLAGGDKLYVLSRGEWLSIAWNPK